MRSALRRCEPEHAVRRRPTSVRRERSGRRTHERTVRGTVLSTYDAAGRRVRLTHPDSFPVSYDRDVTGQVTAIRHWDAGGGHGVLARYVYDDWGRTYARHFGYDGTEVISEYDDSGNVLRRYVHGPGVDEPLAVYDGNGADATRWFVQDELGSTIALVDRAGAYTINRYDEYGVPAAGNQGLFQYTGQMWLSEAGVYHYKARAYSPTLGRFLQPDPIGLAGGSLNLYAYVGNDPVNATDPSGLVKTSRPTVQGINQTGSRLPGGCSSCMISGSLGSAAHLSPRMLLRENTAIAVALGATVFNGTVFNLGPYFDYVLYGTLPGGSALPVDMPVSGNRAEVRPRDRAALDRIKGAAATAEAVTPSRAPAWLRGIAVHVAFAAGVRGLGPGFHAEVSYRSGRPVGYGTFGSSRADAIFGDRVRPQFVFDLKTGHARMRASQLGMYAINLPFGTPVYWNVTK